MDDDQKHSDAIAELDALAPEKVIAASLAMFQEVLEARAIVRDGNKADRQRMYNKMSDALDWLYRGKEALGKL